MSRAIGPDVGFPREAVLPFTILGLCWLPVAGLAAVWVGGRTASALTGHGWSGPGFGWAFAKTLLAGPGMQHLWPSDDKARDDIREAIAWMDEAEDGS